jgi:hypothetical protein
MRSGHKPAATTALALSAQNRASAYTTLPGVAAISGRLRAPTRAGGPIGRVTNVVGQHNETATGDQASDAVTALGSART